MKIALIGASGFVGAPILAEALARSKHDITALVRHPRKLAAHPLLTAKTCDIYDVPALTAALRGHDALIHAFHPGRGVTSEAIYGQCVVGHKAIINASKGAGITRLLCVGGAASLKTPQGVEFIDSPMWPTEFNPYKAGVLGTRALYYLLKEEPTLDWVFLAPSVILRPGRRTGAYRKGGDHVLFDRNGVSQISLEDYAVAMNDELDTPTQHRKRFTVGY
jgi:hypothetical protein